MFIIEPMNGSIIRPAPVRCGIKNQNMKKDAKKTNFLAGFGLSKISAA